MTIERDKDWVEAMKQWLEALENSVDLVIADAYNAEQLYGKYPSRQARVSGLKLLADEHQQAITSLRQAIAEAEKQEPFEYWNAVEGWVKLDEVREHFDSVNCGTIYKNDGEGRVPLYTHPQPKREWVGLTDEDFQPMVHKAMMYYGYDPKHSTDRKSTRLNSSHT